MSDGDLVPEVTPADAGLLLELKALGSVELERRADQEGLTLTGDAAIDVRDALGQFGKAGSTALGALRDEKLYRLVAPEHLRADIASGTAKWATSKTGDASVLIHKKGVRGAVGQGDLFKARSGAAKVAGPAAIFELAAVATQQRYLIEITGKLEAIEQTLSETLQRDEDDKVGGIKRLRRLVRQTRDAMDDGRPPSTERVAELRQALSDIDRVWSGLHQRAERHVASYRMGKTSAEDMQLTWRLLLAATQALGECAALLTALPFDDLEETRTVTAEERERVLHAIDEVRVLAELLVGAHTNWSDSYAEWTAKWRRTAPRRVAGRVRRKASLQPPAAPVDYLLAWQASQLAQPPAPPTALLVAVHKDGTVDVVTETADVRS